MPSITVLNIAGIASLNVDYSLDATGLTVGASLNIEGTDYSLGSETFNPDNTSFELSTPSIFGVSASLSAGIDTSSCTVSLTGTINYPIDRSDSKSVGFQYGNPWPFPTSGSLPSPNLTKDDVARIKSEPRVGASSPAGGFDNSPATLAALDAALWLCGTSLGALRAGTTEIAQAGVAQAGNDTDFLYAVGFQVGGGALVGLGAEFGVYWTASGDAGTFGGWQVDAGFLLQLAAGIPVYLFWGGKTSFEGVCKAVVVDVSGQVIGCSAALYWSGLDIKDKPVGMCIEPDTGPSAPVQVYESISTTYLGQLYNWWDLVPPVPSLQPAGVAS